MRLKQFGTIVLPELNGVDNISTQARDNTLMLQDGAYDLDGNEVFLQPSTVSRQATLTESIDDTLDNLFGEMRKGRNILIAERRDGTEVQTFAKMNVFARSVNAQNYTCQQEVNLSWTMNYPYWLLSSDEPYYFDTGWNFDSGINLDDYNTTSVVFSGSESVDFTVTNNSKFRVYRLGIVLVKTSFTNQANYVTITNNTINESIRYNAPLGNLTSNAASRVDIDCLSKQSFSTYYTNAYSVLVISNKYNWLWLEPGANSFNITTNSMVGGTGLTAYIVHSRHYL